MSGAQNGEKSSHKTSKELQKVWLISDTSKQYYQKQALLMLSPSLLFTVTLNPFPTLLAADNMLHQAVNTSSQYLSQFELLVKNNTYIWHRM